MQLLKLNRNRKWKRLLAAALALVLTVALSAALAEGERSMDALKRGARTFKREGAALEARPDASRRPEGAKLPGPAADDSEQSLRRLLSDASGWERFEYFYRADYDGDGSAEAFALAGTFDGSAYAGELWFVRSDRARRLQQGLRYAALEITSAAPGLAFRAVECDDGATHTWTVQNGAPRRAEAALPEPTAAPEAIEPEGEGSEPEAAEAEAEDIEPEATLEAVEPEAEGIEPEATPKAVGPEGEDIAPEAEADAQDAVAVPEEDMLPGGGVMVHPVPQIEEPAAEPDDEASAPAAAPEAVEVEGEGIEPEATSEAVEPEVDGIEPEVTPEAVEAESEGIEPEAAPEVVEAEGEGIEPEAAPEAVEAEGEGIESEAAPEAAEPEGEGIEPAATPEAVEPEGEGIEPEAMPEVADAVDGVPDVRAGEDDADWYCRGGGRCGQMYCGADEDSGCNSDCAFLSGGMHCARANAASDQIQDSQPEVPQAEVPQVEVPQAEAPQTEIPQVEAPQAEIPQTEPASASGVEATEGYATEGYATEGYATEGYATEGYATEGYASGDYASEGYATEGYATEDYATEDYATEGYASGAYPGEAYTGNYAYGDYPADGHATEGYATDGYATEGYASGAYPGEAYTGSYAYGDYAADGHATEGYASEGYATEGYATEGYATEGYASGAYPGEAYTGGDAYGSYATDGCADGAYYGGVAGEGYPSENPGAETLRVAEDAQLRTGPGAGFGVLSELPAGAEVESLGEQAQDELGAVWCYLRSGERAGWCPAECLESGEAAAAADYAYAADEANLRSGPGLQSGVIARIPGGAAVEYLGESVTDGLGATWHYVRYRNWQGWCASVVVSAAP